MKIDKTTALSLAVIMTISFGIGVKYTEYSKKKRNKKFVQQINDYSDSVVRTKRSYVEDGFHLLGETANVAINIVKLAQ